MTPLWTAAEAAAATGGAASGDWIATGISIDSRTLMPGDLFVALSGPSHDGHDFTAAAFARGAAAAMVSCEVSGLPGTAKLLQVGDTLAGLTALGAAARRRSNARIVGVTGSVGKTGTKEALRLAFAASGTVAASIGSLNNHWGVPLSLARMPREAEYGVFELGMNHSGEIAALSRLVRPHIAIVTTIAPAHVGHFRSIAAIADAKAEIFLGLEPGGTAILNRDNRYFTRLAAAATKAGAGIVGFGAHSGADARLVAFAPDEGGSTVTADLGGARMTYRLGVAGRHWAINSLAVLAAIVAAGAPLEPAAAALSGLQEPPGRGRRHDLAWQGGRLFLIDESYNASPAAVRAALDVLGAAQPAAGGRRVAVLGDMLELGQRSTRLHRALASRLAAANVDRAFLVGSAMAALHDELPPAMRGGLWPCADAAIPTIIDFLRPGDVVTVKGSHAGGISRVVERLRAQVAPAGA
jgi:UDP-N-acetylmuramoyl-tripeptide--D-alanyl-D-alanine ligase